jgi:hypothetical protein
MFHATTAARVDGPLLDVSMTLGMVLIGIGATSIITGGIPVDVPGSTNVSIRDYYSIDPDTF